MYWGGTPIPATVALSLGMYFAERCKGEFPGETIVSGDHMVRCFLAEDGKEAAV